MSGEQGRQPPPGRPRNDDSRRAAGVLFEARIVGHDLNKVLRIAADDLRRESQAAANAAAARGERKPVITEKAARKRLGQAVRTELTRFGPLAGLPPAFLLLAQITGAAAQRHGYPAGRQLLVEALAHDLAYGRFRDPVGHDPATGGRRRCAGIELENAWCRFECLVLADEYIAEIEAQCGAAMNGENPTQRR